MFCFPTYSTGLTLLLLGMEGGGTCNRRPSVRPSVGLDPSADSRTYGIARRDPFLKQQHKGGEVSSHRRRRPHHHRGEAGEEDWNGTWEEEEGALHGGGGGGMGRRSGQHKKRRRKKNFSFEIGRIDDMQGGRGGGGGERSFARGQWRDLPIFHGKTILYLLVLTNSYFLPLPRVLLNSILSQHKASLCSA